MAGTIWRIPPGPPSRHLCAFSLQARFLVAPHWASYPAPERPGLPAAEREALALFGQAHRRSARSPGRSTARGEAPKTIFCGLGRFFDGLIHGLSQPGGRAVAIRLPYERPPRRGGRVVPPLQNRHPLPCGAQNRFAPALPMHCANTARSVLCLFLPLIRFYPPALSVF